MLDKGVKLSPFYIRMENELTGSNSTQKGISRREDYLGFAMYLADLES